MLFALLGTHPDGIEMARALTESGRHHLAAYSDQPPEPIQPLFGGAKLIGDVEEILADPTVDAIIVAGSGMRRAEQLRRGLQSERHVMCVHPADETPEIAYEAGMLQLDTGRVLMPLLPHAFHPAVRRLGEFVQRTADDPQSPVGPFSLLEMEIQSEGSVLEYVDASGPRASLPGWEMLRTVGGDVAEIFAFGVKDIMEPNEPLIIGGTFLRTGLFRVSLLSQRPEPSWRLAIVGAKGTAELLFTVGRQGPAFLSWRDSAGERHEESWDPWDPWPTLVGQFESALETAAKAKTEPKPSDAITAAEPQSARVAATSGAIQIEGAPIRGLAVTRDLPPLRLAATAPPAPLIWQDEVRCLELDDAVRRSLYRRRSTVLEYQEANEEVGFKGTMTLIGCGLLWAIMGALMLTPWLPFMMYAIVPLLGLFLLLQFLQYAIPAKDDDAKKGLGMKSVAVRADED